MHPTFQGAKKHTWGGHGPENGQNQKEVEHFTPNKGRCIGGGGEEKERRNYTYAKMGKGAHSTNTIQRQIRVTCSDLGLNLIQSLPSPNITKVGERPFHFHEHGKITLIEPENVGRAGE